MSTKGNAMSQTASSLLISVKNDILELEYAEQNSVLLELVKSIRKSRAEAIQKTESELKEMKQGYNELDVLMQDEIIPSNKPEQKKE